MNETNPYYPLPEDYPTLTVEGQKEARLSTLRKQDTPEDLVNAWVLFRNLYLRPRGEAFYQSGFKKSPDFHYQLIRDLGQWSRNAQAAPRGFAKCGRWDSLISTLSGYKKLKNIKKGEKILSLDSSLKLSWKKVIAVEYSGKKSFLKITTKQGHRVFCSKEHRILTNNTWIAGGDLKIGDLIATPRTSLPTQARGKLTILDSELLGILTGDGSTTSCCQITTFDKEIIQTVLKAVKHHPDWQLRKTKAKGRWSITNGGIDFIKKHGLFGHKSTEKRIPQAVWEASDECLAAFLRGLFDTDGTVSKQNGSISLTLANKDLIRDVQLALLRLGIRSRYTYRKAKYSKYDKEFDSWGLHISSAEARLKFRDLVGFRIKRKMILLDNIEIGHDATDNIYFPFEEKQRLPLSMWKFRQKYGIRIDNHYRITRLKLKKVAEITGRQDLMNLATSDIYWDPVISIEDGGADDAYDIQVEDNANFLCEGIFVHNSTVIGVEAPLLLALTRPYFSIAMGMSTDRLIEGRFDRLMIELTENPQITADFGVIKPLRGTAIWNHHHLHLANGSVIEGFSVMGRKRGARPRLFILDDPEFDSEATGGSSNSQYLITEKYEQILFRQIIPMLAKGSAIFWIGTMINRRCLLYRACEGDDPRFGVWMRRVYVAEDTTRTKALWDAAWPLEFLRAREMEIGTSAYSSEYLNRPLTDETKLLQIDPDFNEYIIPDYRTMEPQEQAHLLSSTKEVFWNERKRVGNPGEAPDFETEKKQGQIHKVFGSMYRVALVDTASGLEAKNDYRSIAILGFDHNNCLWVLDLWLGKVKDSVFYRKIYEMGQKWLVRAIGIEACGTQGNLVDSMGEYVNEFTRKLGASGGESSIWVPRVIPIRYPARMSKGDRIAGLEWRFNAGKIKYPHHRVNEWPFSALYEQTENFTRDLALLRYDDAIDTVAMSIFLVHTRGRESAKAPAKKTLSQQIKSGEPIAPGLPLLSGVNPSDLTAEEMRNLLANFYSPQNEGKYKTRNKPNIITR